MYTKIIRHQEQKTSSWTGGKTTELFIHPETADYAQRNFDFRLSSAKIELEQSVFTPLKDTSRTLLILDGNITIHHKGQAPKRLNKFDTDQFMGDWETKSEGICTDFNLMTKGTLKGNVKALAMNENAVFNYKIPSDVAWFFIYVFTGSVQVNIDDEKHFIHSLDLLMSEQCDAASIQINCMTDAEIVFTEIFSI